jgi:hypothetical protein
MMSSADFICISPVGEIRPRHPLMCALIMVPQIFYEQLYLKRDFSKRTPLKTTSFRNSIFSK